MIAYLILVDRNIEQFSRMFEAVHHPDNLYLVHVDLNAGPALGADVARRMLRYPNVNMAPSRRVTPGDYSLADIVVRGMASLLRSSSEWSYFINLSDQDFPLKSQSDIEKFLSHSGGREFIKVMDQQKLRPDTLARIQAWPPIAADAPPRGPGHRPYVRGATPYIGNPWMMVTRAFCQYVIHAPEAARFKDFYRDTQSPEEGLFQSIMMNSRAHGDIVSDDMRAMQWIRDEEGVLSPKSFTLDDADALVASGDLFARPFDLAADEAVIARLEDHLAGRVPAPLAPPRIDTASASLELAEVA